MVLYCLIKKKNHLNLNFLIFGTKTKKKFDNYIFFQYLVDKSYNINSD